MAYRGSGLRRAAVTGLPSTKSVLPVYATLSAAFDGATAEPPLHAGNMASATRAPAYFTKTVVFNYGFPFRCPRTSCGRFPESKQQPPARKQAVNKLVDAPKESLKVAPGHSGGARSVGRLAEGRVRSSYVLTIIAPALAGAARIDVRYAVRNWHQTHQEALRELMDGRFSSYETTHRA